MMDHTDGVDRKQARDAVDRYAELAHLLDRQPRTVLTHTRLKALLEGAGLEFECSARFMATRFWGMMCMVGRRPAAT